MLRFDPSTNGIGLACDVCGVAMREADARVFYRTDIPNRAAVVHKACIDFRTLWTDAEITAQLGGKDLPAVHFEVLKIVRLGLEFDGERAGDMSVEAYQPGSTPQPRRHREKDSAMSKDVSGIDDLVPGLQDPLWQGEDLEFAEYVRQMFRVPETFTHVTIAPRGPAGRCLHTAQTLGVSSAPAFQGRASALYAETPSITRLEGSRWCGGRLWSCPTTPETTGFFGRWSPGRLRVQKPSRLGAGPENRFVIRFQN
jgi:hypothetical protein